MAADAQYPKILVAIVVSYSIFVMYMKKLPTRRGKEVSAAAFACPAALCPETFRNDLEIRWVVVDGRRLNGTSWTTEKSDFGNLSKKRRIVNWETIISRRCFER
jgi:hypothetical protein